MFLPLRDENPLRIVPFQAVTVAIIAACVAVFLWQTSLPERAALEFVYSYGLVPAVVFDLRHLPPDLVRIPVELTVISSMFLHGGWLHLAGNMLYLWVFGDNIEDSMGHARFVVFYLVCGVVAALAHALVDPASEIPMVGASGAISGVLGAYLVLHPRVKVLVLILFRIPMYLPAYVVLGSYIVLQFVYVLFDAGGNVAIWAHIGGFAAGAVLIPFFRYRSIPLGDRGVRH